MFEESDGRLQVVVVVVESLGHLKVFILLMKIIGAIFVLDFTEHAAKYVTQAKTWATMAKSRSGSMMKR